MIRKLSPDGRPPLGPMVWDDTSIGLADGRALRDVFTGSELVPAPCHSGYVLPAAAIFERFPVALLVPADASGARSISGTEPTPAA
jgi:maltooligosyltrehalose synthase